jgi:hypothetical protein
VNLDEHPTVKQYRERQASAPVETDRSIALDANRLRQLCLDIGADDVGFKDSVPWSRKRCSADWPIC